jgi:hypothetical protein
MALSTDMKRWPLHRWESGFAKLETQASAMAEGQYKLLILLLGVDYDASIVEYLLVAERDLQDGAGAFVLAAIFVPPSNTPRSPARNPHDATFEYEPVHQPLVQFSELDEFTDTMRRGTYELATRFGIRFDELPGLLLLRPEDTTDYVFVTLKERNLGQVYADLTRILYQWRSENLESIERAAELRALRAISRGWPERYFRQQAGGEVALFAHPVTDALLRKDIYPQIEAALVEAAAAAKVDLPYVLDVFRRFRKNPATSSRISGLLEVRNLELKIAGRLIDHKSFHSFLNEWVKRAAADELRLRPAEIVVPSFPMQRLAPLVATDSGTACRLQDIRTVSVGPPEQILGGIENALATQHPSFKAVKVFISYSRADERFKTALDKHLSSLKRSGLVSVWHDGMIEAGGSWSDVIVRELESANMILLLISADFIASEYCWSLELRRALERRASGVAEVVPIIVRPADWENTPVAELQVLPANGIPISSSADQDFAYLDVVRGLRRVAERMVNNGPVRDAGS